MRALTPLLAFVFAEKQLRRNLRAFAQFLAVIAGTVVLFSAGFRLLMQYHEGRQFTWITSLYWTLTVMSTLGFGDITFHTDTGRVFSIVVLLTGIVMFVIVLPFAFIRYFYAPWLEAQIRFRVPREAPASISGHVIICRYDTIARGLVDRLRSLGIPHFVIESDPTVAGALHSDGISVVLGEYDSRPTYAALHADRARLVFANVDDAGNTNVTLTVREQAPDVPVAALIEDEESTDVLELSGATCTLPIKQRLGEHLAARVAAGHIHAHVVGRFRDLLIAEFPVRNTPLAGRTIRDTNLRGLAGITILAHAERGVLKPVQADTILGEDSVAVVIGNQNQIDGLNSLFVIYEPNDNPVVVIGAGKVGLAVVKALRQRGVAVHLVERNEALRTTLTALADLVFIGDAADRDLLMAAGLATTPSVVLTTNDDAMNIFLAIFCRRLNPHLRIVSRITHERNLEAIHRAGADSVLSYSSLGVKSLLAILHRRELVVLEEGADIFVLKVPPSLANKTLTASGIRARTGLNVIALQEGDEAVTNPPASARLPPGGEIIVIGSTEQRIAFTREFAR
jgi:Trk K+ transport system NAD-binding subunit